VAEPLAPGVRFGDYEIRGELGAGGMGRVYRALDVNLDRPVALKTLASDLTADPGFVQRFLKEARALARMNHPNIVQIYGFGAVEGTYFLAMELVDGASLAAHLKSRHWPEAEAVRIVRQACRALAVAHADGIVHRDIKPDNLILTRRGDIKLVDFGIAKRVDEEQSMTRTGSAVGTPHYIAPEQVRGERELDGRVDIYSLGATLYHLVTGHTPYEGSSGAHVMSMHLFAPLPDPRRFEPTLSDGICRVLRKMLAKEREERYPDIAALDRDLAMLAEGGSPEPIEPTATAISPHYESRRVAPSAGGGTGGFDSAVLERIEEQLATAIGPMARVVVRRSAREGGSLAALCDRLADQIAPGEQREAFRRRCLAGEAATPPPGGRTAVSGRGTGIGVAPVPGAATPPPAAERRAESALGAADLQRVEAELARRIGPLARVLVKRAAAGGGSLAELVARLESNIPDDAGRVSFRIALLGGA